MLAATRDRLRAAGVQSVDEVKQLQEPLVQESPALTPLIAEWRQFLHARVYRHPSVLEMAERAQKMIRALVAHYLQYPERMPPYYTDRAQVSPLNRVVGDYLSGMTDRLAVQEYGQLFQSTEKSDRMKTSS